MPGSAKRFVPSKNHIAILSWCPHNQSCKGNLCQLWDQNEAECLLRLEILLRIKKLKRDEEIEKRGMRK